MIVGFKLCKELMFYIVDEIRAIKGGMQPWLADAYITDSEEEIYEKYFKGATIEIYSRNIGEWEIQMKINNKKDFDRFIRTIELIVGSAWLNPCEDGYFMVLPGEKIEKIKKKLIEMIKER